MERRVKKQVQPSTESHPESLVFFHPDLGIGGAERLVVDAAVGLQKVGHKITIFTSHRDKTHCFDEARDGTLDVRVRGDWIIPATLLGRFKILCSILRQIHLILAVTWSGELGVLKPTAFFVDQLSAGIPFLRWFWEDQKILFYCHFPDLLLVQGRRRWYKRIWRIGFDWWEGWGIRGADRVVVNSGFTKGVVEQIWPGLGGEGGIGVVYPCVNTSESAEDRIEGGQRLWKDTKVLLSINRFERKKNVELAIKAFAGLSPDEQRGTRLVIAGTCAWLHRQVQSPLTFTRWLRYSRARKCSLPQRAPIPRRHPNHLPRDSQELRFRPLHPFRHLTPFPPLRTFPTEVFSPRLCIPPHLHPLQRTFRHRPPRSNARRCPRPRSQHRRPIRNRLRPRNWLATLRRQSPRMDKCNARRPSRASSHATEANGSARSPTRNK